MMRKSLFNTPTPRAGAEVIADFAELLALRNPGGTASVRDVMSALERPSEEHDDEDHLEQPLTDAFQELTARILHLGSMAAELYPFDVEDDLLRLRRSPVNDRDYLYLFLLLATRLNMSNDRVHSGVDGSLLFEEVSLEVAKRFLGHPDDPRVAGLLFGTARYVRGSAGESIRSPSRFANAINELCRLMGEGGGYRPKGSPPTNAKDAKLDVVVWKRFTDQGPSPDTVQQRQGRLIGFGQCKTGDHWQDDVAQLQPESFCEDWFHDPPLIKPVKFFFVSSRFRHPWHQVTRGMLFFDRCRILEYADRVAEPLIRSCRQWTRAALKAHGVTL